ncbi:cupin domain-containing protein [Risungbinella massiliensis]|uniref:cupin domain-containing protein n=1 Tax=Risungbinella massiliensis TaxID=1329796 RepID=UPI0009E51F02|nr:cupin domain-containing protein [Risungbinella massiliensis]
MEMYSKGVKQHLDRLSEAITERHQNFIVNTVNESCLRLAVLDGEYEWHYHPDSDELFIVLEGELWIDFQDKPSISLQPHEMITIPANEIHRTRSNMRTVNLCLEHTHANTIFV